MQKWGVQRGWTDNCECGDGRPTIIPQMSVGLSVCPSVRLSVCTSVRLYVCPSVRLSVCHSISTEIVRTVHFALGQCVARNPTMCIFCLSLYGCGQGIQLNDFASCSLAFIANVVVMPTVSQERFIPQLIARGLPFNQKLYRLSKTVH